MHHIRRVLPAILAAWTQRSGVSTIQMITGCLPSLSQAEPRLEHFVATIPEPENNLHPKPGTMLAGDF